jgi:hypothetical protein
MDTNAQIQTAAVGAAKAVPPTPDTPPTPPPTPEPIEGEEGNGEARSEKIQWITLLILGLSVVSLVMNIISNKKQIEKLSEDDKSSAKKLKELETNLRKAMGKKYEPLD